MRFPRMTMRRWIVAVVVVIGSMIGGGVLLIRQRRDYFRTPAQSHHNEVAPQWQEERR